MKILKEIKVFSLCEDFSDEQFSSLSEDVSPNCYIEYTAYSEESLREQGFENDTVSNRLIELGCKEGEEVLIEIDY